MCHESFSNKKKHKKKKLTFTLFITNDMDSVIKNHRQQTQRRSHQNSIEKQAQPVPRCSIEQNIDFITVINDAYQNSLDKQTIGSISQWATCNLRRWLSIRDTLCFCYCCRCRWVTSWMSIALSIQQIHSTAKPRKLQTENFQWHYNDFTSIYWLLTTRFFLGLTSFFFHRKGFIERVKYTHIDINSVAQVDTDCLLIAHDVSAKKNGTATCESLDSAGAFFSLAFDALSLSFYFYANRTSAIDEIQQTFADANWNWRYHDRNSQFIDRRHRCCCCWHTHKPPTLLTLQTDYWRNPETCKRFVVAAAAETVYCAAVRRRVWMKNKK